MENLENPKANPLLRMNLIKEYCVCYIPCYIFGYISSYIFEFIFWVIFLTLQNYFYDVKRNFFKKRLDKFIFIVINLDSENKGVKND